MSIYDEHGLRPIINAAGPLTRLGGARMSSRVIDAYARAADQAVPMEELHAVASSKISAITNTEAALVTSGASAGLMLAAAAVMARLDFSIMQNLPQTNGAAHEFIVARSHRTGYDRAILAAGGRFVEVGMDEMSAGAGVRRTECWDYKAAVTEHTAAILYALHTDSQPSIWELIRVAHDVAIPVIVDASAQLPPASNLHGICATGADLVVFSGGKAIGGPQATGILCGRREFIGSAFLQMMDLDEHFETWDPPPEFVEKHQLSGFPRHGIGRMLKVSKEQIISLLAALSEFCVPEAGERRRSWQEQCVQRICGSLSHLPGLVSIRDEVVPKLEIRIPESAMAVSAWEVYRLLRAGTPPIHVGHAGLAQGHLVIDPSCLTDAQIPVVIDRLTEVLGES